MWRDDLMFIPSLIITAICMLGLVYIRISHLDMTELTALRTYWIEYLCLAIAGTVSHLIWKKH